MKTNRNPWPPLQSMIDAHKASPITHLILERCPLGYSLTGYGFGGKSVAGVVALAKDTLLFVAANHFGSATLEEF